MKTLRGISLLSNSASSLSYFIHFILATCLPYHTIPPHDYSTNKKKKKMTQGQTSFKSKCSSTAYTYYFSKTI